MFGRRGNAAVGAAGQARPVLRDDAPAGVGQAGVDPHDDAPLCHATPLAFALIQTLVRKIKSFFKL